MKIKVISHEKVNELNFPQSLPGYQEILEHLRNSGQEDIYPVRNHERKVGYEYPAVAPFFQNFEEKVEVQFLEKMVEDDFLTARLIDVVHLCPSCGHHDINFREICPHCQSLNITQMTYYRHKKCGHKTWENQIKNKSSFRCSACERLVNLNSPEVSKEHIFRCLDCLYNIVDIQMNCHCLNCGKVFGIGQATKHKIYAFQVKKKPKVTPLPPPRKASLLEKIVEKTTRFYLPLDAFQQKIDLEILRAQRHEDGLSLIAIEFREFFDFLIKNRDTTLTRLLVQSIHIIDRTLRKNDSMTVKSRTQILLLLPRMHQNLAKIVGKKILHDLAMLHSIRLKMNLASFPEDGMNGHEILNILELDLEQLEEVL